MGNKNQHHRTRTVLVLSIAGVCFAAACAGNGNQKDPVQKSSEPSEAPPSNLLADEAEIIQLEDMPKVAVTGGDDIPSDPKALKVNALEELEAGNTRDALSMIDVLLVLNPEDAELVEIRSDILMKQGQKEDTAVDRARCCKLGRKTCCP